ncbi:hypothetical protein TBLA_0G00140 [Henningerozyma blattae CBS 6284]|uniref:Globin domain-containing protein n=1 Tax=Henningerozyma blattae (strain ATCC 34711 / CBS 6284 / DSM 70876 / NBRC 10599 / NRRL Y-10934 / UCD 77-7) TaxID=1071380 RepID=I2H6G3_HENB6|nr:hypothetical protein TBLA_0G00140 [Tetrapisispora blattae CBS 6284]CCH61965.1 hypothetical protein TBLA_0G00140 [Tetrapisispora blattae CBS 6284]
MTDSLSNVYCPLDISQIAFVEDSSDSSDYNNDIDNDNNNEEEVDMINKLNQMNINNHLINYNNNNYTNNNNNNNNSNFTILRNNSNPNVVTNYNYSYLSKRNTQYNNNIHTNLLGKTLQKTSFQRPKNSSYQRSNSSDTSSFHSISSNSNSNSLPFENNHTKGYVTKRRPSNVFDIQSKKNPSLKPDLNHSSSFDCLDLDSSPTNSKNNKHLSNQNHYNYLNTNDWKNFDLSSDPSNFLNDNFNARQHLLSSLKNSNSNSNSNQNSITASLSSNSISVSINNSIISNSNSISYPTNTNDGQIHKIKSTEQSSMQDSILSKGNNTTSFSGTKIPNSQELEHFTSLKSSSFDHEKLNSKKIVIKNLISTAVNNDNINETTNEIINEITNNSIPNSIPSKSITSRSEITDITTSFDGIRYKIVLQLNPREIQLLRDSWALMLSEETPPNTFSYYYHKLIGDPKRNARRSTLQNKSDDEELMTNNVPRSNNKLDSNDPLSNVPIKRGPTFTTGSLFCHQFYENLVAMDPELEQLFPTLKHQSSAFAGVLNNAMLNLENLESMEGYLSNLGKRHSRIFGIETPYFELLGVAFLKTLQDRVGSLYTFELERTWSRLYSYLANSILQFGIDPVLKIDTKNQNVEFPIPDPEQNTKTTISSYSDKDQLNFYKNKIIRLKEETSHPSITKTKSEPINEPNITIKSSSWDNEMNRTKETQLKNGKNILDSNSLNDSNKNRNIKQLNQNTSGLNSTTALAQPNLQNKKDSKKLCIIM